MEANTTPTDEWDEVEIGDDGEFVSRSDVEVVEDDDRVSDEVEPVYMETSSGAVIDIANPELTYEEAKELTEHIRATADMLYVLIARAHAGKAWLALGYESFKEYVGAEFNISRSRAYQLLDQARVVEAIAAAAPEGTEINITEADARDVKSALDELVPAIQERLAEADEDDDAGSIIEDLVREFREKQDEELGGESYDEEYEGDLADREGFSGSYEGGGDFIPEDDEDDDVDIDELLDFEDPADVRRKFESVYALYTSLGALKEMPSVEEVIAWVPEERKVQVSASLPRALEWLQEFNTAWFANGDNTVEDTEEDSEDEASADDDFADDPEVDDIFG